jgi:branched-chain amino acid transport system ATP-binding protein
LADIALVLDRLEAWYGHAQALFDVSFSLQQGEALALVGTNGAGKSTIIRSILGLIRTRGKVEIDGIAAERMPTYARIREFGIGVVHEGRGLFGPLSVRDNLLAGLGRNEQLSLDVIIEHFPQLKGRFDEPVSKLSGGEQQMVALGRIVLRKPKLLLIDEPCLGLSPALTNEIYEALRRMRSDNTSILLVEQNVRRAQEFADRMCLIRIGHSEQIIGTDDDAAVATIEDVALGREPEIAADEARK